MAITPFTPRVIRAAVFECFRFGSNISQTRGQFGDVFRAWLLASAESYNANRRPEEQVRIETSSWDVEHGMYPDNLENTDAIIVTGSTASAYDQEPWIIALEKYLQDVHAQNPRIRIYGGCFGHQLVSQALLGQHGVRVEKSPKGWEIGVHDVRLNPKFKAAFPGLLKGQDVLSCQFLHADHVVVPSEGLPESWVSMGSSNLCDVQGIYQPGRVLTYQGHPEFDTFINEQAVLSLGESGTLDTKQLKDSLELIH
ncbi:class I glutamine amidotransferase-like protein, partial [Thozetella sp. PMI_491]